MHFSCYPCTLIYVNADVLWKSCHLWQTWIVWYQSCWELRAQTVAAPQSFIYMSCFRLSNSPASFVSLFRSQMRICAGNRPAKNININKIFLQQFGNDILRTIFFCWLLKLIQLPDRHWYMIKLYFGGDVQIVTSLLTI